MDIGRKIRELRKGMGLTQEQLSESIGISFQAVSKWENGITMPDISTIPMLASFFGISIDELFGYNLKEIELEIEEIVTEAVKYRESDCKRSRAILEKGLEKYPDNEILLNNLLYVITEPDETIAVASKLVSRSGQSDIKFDALRFMAYAYKKKGELDAAESAIEQIPEIYFTKLTEIAYLFEDERRLAAAEKQKWISFENLLQMMNKLAEYYESVGEYEKAIAETEKALKFIEIANNTCYDSYVDYFKHLIAKYKLLRN